MGVWGYGCMEVDLDLLHRYSATPLLRHSATPTLRHAVTPLLPYPNTPTLNAVNDIAIKVENLSKRYRIGGPGAEYGTLRDTLIDVFRAPVRKAAALLRGQAYGALELNEEIWALKDVSLTVQRGEILGIIGRNGAGKSTLLKILSRITEPTSGRAEIHGRVGSLLEVGTGFHQELTGRENVYLNGAILGMRKGDIQRKFEEIVAFSEVEKFLDTPVKFYSSGMRVRLAFAVAAHLNPEVLLIDEVLAVGDAEFQKKCLGKMGGVAREGRTVILVSHNMTMVRSLCEKAVLLRDGMIEDSGNVNDVINAYLSIDRKEVLEQAWAEPDQAPGNNELRFKKVSLAPEYRDDSNRIMIDTAIKIDLEFWMMRAGYVNVSMYLRQLSGEIIFASASPRMEIPPGIAGFSCRIPGDLLNDGIYTITVIVVENARHLFTMEDAATFEVHDLPRKGHWFGKWPGAVRPRLTWTHGWRPGNSQNEQSS